MRLRLPMIGHGGGPGGRFFRPWRGKFMSNLKIMSRVIAVGNRSQERDSIVC